METRLCTIDANYVANTSCTTVQTFSRLLPSLTNNDMASLVINVRLLRERREM